MNLKTHPLFPLRPFTSQNYTITGGPVDPPIVLGPELVQQKTGSSSDGSPITVTFDTPVSSGGFIVVCATYSSTDSFKHVDLSGDGGAPIPIDPVPEIISNGIGVSAGIFSSQIASVADETGVYFELNTGATPFVVHISEWSGLNAAASEVTNSDEDFGQEVSIVHSGGGSSANNLSIAVGGWAVDDYAFGPNHSFTRLTPVSVTGFAQETAYLIQTANTPADTTWTLGTPQQWAAAIAVFGAP